MRGRVQRTVQGAESGGGKNPVLVVVRLQGLRLGNSFRTNVLQDIREIEVFTEGGGIVARDI